MFDRATFASRASSSDYQTNRRIQSTALVVEDHPDFLELLAFVLKSLGYSVLQAKNGREALRLAATRQVDLLVTDLGLPEMDGLKLVQLVRAFSPDHRSLKIVMLTAYDVADYEPKALEAGCDVVLSKPVDIQQFERIVRTLRGDPETGPPADKTASRPNAIHQGDMATRHRNATMY
jgi:CheY-like chemotaxis protein